MPFLENARFWALHLPNLVFVLWFCTTYLYYIFIYTFQLTCFHPIPSRRGGAGALWSAQLQSGWGDPGKRRCRGQWVDGNRWVKIGWLLCWRIESPGVPMLIGVDQKNRSATWAMNLFESTDWQTSRLFMGCRSKGVAIPPDTLRRCCRHPSSPQQCGAPLRDRSGAIAHGSVGRVWRTPGPELLPTCVKSEVVLSVPWLHWISFGEAAHPSVWIYGLARLCASGSRSLKALKIAGLDPWRPTISKAVPQTGRYTLTIWRLKSEAKSFRSFQVYLIKTTLALSESGIHQKTQKKLIIHTIMYI